MRLHASASERGTQRTYVPRTVPSFLAPDPGSVNEGGPPRSPPPLTTQMLRHFSPCPGDWPRFCFSCTDCSSLQQTPSTVNRAPTLPGPGSESCPQNEENIMKARSGPVRMTETGWSRFHRSRVQQLRPSRNRRRHYQSKSGFWALVDQPKSRK